jgi:hypothetical protein
LYLYKRNNTWSYSDILQYNSAFVANSPGPTKTLWEQRRAEGRLVINRVAEVMASTWPEAPVPANRTVPASTPTVFGVFSYFSGGAWYMMVRDNMDEPAEGVAQNPMEDTDQVLMVYVTAILLDGTTRCVEARIRHTPPDYKPQGAIVTNGTVELGGNVTIQPAPGVPNADVISNGSLIFSGSSVSVTGNVTAFGTISGSTTGVTGNVVSGAPKAPMPVTDPYYYKPMASYIMTSDGRVTDPMGNTLAIGTYYNFSYSSGMWKISSSTPLPPAVVYFIEGDFELTGNGTFTATLLVTGSVTMQGTGSGMSLTGATGNVALVCGQDFKMTGNSTLTGVVVAQEQAWMSGNSSIQNGAVIARDVSDYSPTVSTKSNVYDKFGGSSTITYAGPQSTFLQVESDSLELMYTRRIK